MQLRLTLTTLVTILFLATACASEPTPAHDTRETDRLSRQIQELQAENETIRNELATLTAAGSEQQQTPATETPVTEISTATPDEPDAKPGRVEATTGNICDRTPVVQRVILSYLQAPYCRAITSEELNRITVLTIRAGEIRQGDFNGLDNLKTLSLALSEALPEGSFSTLDNLKTLSITLSEAPPEGSLSTLPSLEHLSMTVRNEDDPWQPESLFGELQQLVSLEIDSSQIDVSKLDLNGLTLLTDLSIGEIIGYGNMTLPELGQLQTLRLSHPSNSYMDERGQRHAAPKEMPLDFVAKLPELRTFNIVNRSTLGMRFHSEEVACVIFLGYERWTESLERYGTNFRVGDRLYEVDKTADADTCKLNSVGAPDASAVFLEGYTEQDGTHRFRR